jgi:hypothetical protein
MTIKYRGDGLYSGLVTDTKPSAPEGFRFMETDTGDVLVSDGTYWWLTGFPAPFSKRRYGTASISGTTTVGGTGFFNSLLAATGSAVSSPVITDINGRYTNFVSGTNLGDRTGQRYNSSVLINRQQDFKIRFRFQLPAATDYTLSRLYLGVRTNAEPTGDDPLSGANGFMVGFTSANPATAFKVLQNDGTGSTVATADVAATEQATDTNIHDFRMVADQVNTRFSLKWDNNAYVHFNTEIPDSTSAITVIFQNETNESGVAKTFRLFGCRAQTEM